MATSDTPSDERFLPSPMRVLGLIALGIVLTLLLSLFRFPYERLAPALSNQLQTAANVQLEIGDLGPHFSIFGIGMAMHDTRAIWGDGDSADFDTIAIRPAWSLSWFRLDPAIHLSIESSLGEIDGTFTAGERMGWDGTVKDFQLGKLPLDMLLQKLDVTGTANAEIDLHRQAGEAAPPLDGHLSFEVVDGSAWIPGFPIGIPFDKLHGEIEFGGEYTAQVKLLELAGPVLLAEVEGTVGVAEVAGAEPLDLDVVVDVKDAEMKTMLRRSGVRLQRDGSAAIKLSGTMSSPKPI